MANKTVAGIRGYLGTQLATLIGTGSGKLMDVKQGRQATFAGYPACRYYCIGFGEVLRDQKNQYRNIKFAIDVIQKVVGDDKSTTEANLEDAMEAVMNAIDTDYTLGGNSDNTILSVGNVREIDQPWGVALMMTLTLNAYTLQFF